MLPLVLHKFFLIPSHQNPSNANISISFSADVTRPNEPIIYISISFHSTLKFTGLKHRVQTLLHSHTVFPLLFIDCSRTVGDCSNLLHVVMIENG